ncbi:MAG: PspC domain-containing protein [Nanoarchaeota archaeon]|nr:PspC domain-containing protein [Nanoarchaeota archaeon]MBU4300486.1 PspC domain-containing protein [Nanoarchaeota archaeon]MBU4451966.1 PspC domain-containing protein [Nanoarchaeota archaeon]
MQLIIQEYITKPHRRSAETELHHIPSNGVKRLYRSGNDRIIGGVCGGLAEYLGVDPVPIRLIWVILTFAGGSGVLLYLIAWLIIPRNPNHRW